LIKPGEKRIEVKIFWKRSMKKKGKRAVTILGSPTAGQQFWWSFWQPDPTLFPLFPSGVS